MSRSIKCKVSSSYSVQCGIISIDDISKMLSHFERLAKNYQRSQNYDHVIYAHKIYGEDDNLSEIRFYTDIGLTDEEFEKRTSAIKGIIYAIHKR
ncbi:MAG: hypothetical protein SPJ27_00890 [Candidatus Onthovivens sp.]|nr:hypothetical protein [Candidatus Onthovivens sp.]